MEVEKHFPMALLGIYGTTGEIANHPRAPGAERVGRVSEIHPAKWSDGTNRAHNVFWKGGGGEMINKKKEKKLNHIIGNV